MTFKIISHWKDDLIWCPSQCYFDFEYNNTHWQIYLRWRWSDPWTATLRENPEEKVNGDTWHSLDIPYFIDNELEQCKVAAIHASMIMIKSLIK